jgi:hydroxypyruvate isomerase
VNGRAGHPFSLSMSILLAEVPLLGRAAVARRLGYGSVESWWPWDETVASSRQIAEFAEALETAGTDLLLLNVCEGDERFGSRGLAGVPAADDAFWRNWASVLEVVERTGATHINVLVGSARGADHGRLLDRLTERLAVLADQAHDVGAGVVVEQLNRFDHPHYLLTSPEQAVTVTTRARALSRHGNIGLLTDVYHLARSGTDPVAFVAENADLVRHVQLADEPGRTRPGTGSIPIRETLDTLVAAGYDGMIGLEYTPATDELVALARPDELWRSLRAPVPQGDFSS